MKRIPAGHRFAVTETEVRATSISKVHDGIRIAQLSDIHVGVSTPKARLRRVIAHLNETKPDVVVMTGDYVTWARYALQWMKPYLEGIESPVVCVLGNHDHVVDALRARTELEQLGYCVLQNDVRILPLRDHPFAVVGIDDGHTKRDDVEGTFRKLPAGVSSIVLAHTPKTAAKLPQNAGLVCLAGHLHGGQIRVGNLTDRLANAVLGEPYLAGLHHVNGNQLYVHRGLGYGRGSLMPRFRSDPELAMLTLRHAA